MSICGRLPAACALAAVVAMAAGCGSGGSAASGKSGGGSSSAKLTFSADYSPPPFDLAAANTAWANAVKRKSGGKLDIKLNFGGALFANGTDAARAIAAGQLDLASVNTPNLEVILPDIQIVDVPFKGKPLTGDHDLTAPGTPLFQALSKEANKKHVTLLPAGEMISGEEVILTVDPVKSLSDLRGMKIRSPGDDIGNAIITGLDAHPINLAPSDLASALKTGTVDGAIATVAFANSVAKGLVKTAFPLGISGSGYLTVASADAWNGLSADAQNIMSSSLVKAAQDEIDQLAPGEKTAEKQFEAQGPQYTVHQLTPPEQALLNKAISPLCAQFKGRVSPEVFDAFSKTAAQKGYPVSCG